MGWSNQCPLVLNAVHLQFQYWFVPISLKPDLRSVAAYVMATVWLSCSQLLPPGRGFSIYKMTHRFLLQILFIAFEKELKVLNYA